MIIRSRCIFDGVSDIPYEGYIRIDGDKISKVSADYDDMESFGEEVFDAGDRTVMAGFCDNHVHIFLAALDLETCSLRGTESEWDAAERLWKFYENRDDEWVIGFGWCNYEWPGGALPTKESLDAYFPDRPAMLVNDELHALWVNSRALEICGVNGNTASPEYGEIQKGGDGEPTGYILEQSAMRIFTDKAFRYTRGREKQLIEKFIDVAHKKGVTSVGDMEIIGVMKNEAYGELEAEKKLKLRVFFSPSIMKSVDELMRTKADFASDNLSMLGAKGFIDGTPLGHTGLMVEDYSDIPGFKGKPVICLEKLRMKVKTLNERGIPVRLHACGDGAVREALDAMEAAGGVRNTVEHVECINKVDIGRFAATGAIASIQPNHMTMDSIEDHPALEILGPKRCKLAWPAKTLSLAGACVSLGTDCPIVPLDPMMTLYCAVNRLMEDGTPEGGWNPAEKYSIAEAVKGVTVSGAYLMGMEDKIGTLEEGKYADIVVLSDNIFKIDSRCLRGVNVDLTVWNGEKVYEKGGQYE